MCSAARVLVALIFANLLASTASAEAERGISILLHRDGDRVIYEVDGRKVSLQEVSDRLREAYEQIGKNGSVAVLAHTEVPIAAVTNLRGVLQAIGFLNIRYFYFNDRTGRMGEWSFDFPAVPFSLRPWDAKRTSPP